MCHLSLNDVFIKALVKILFTFRPNIPGKGVGSALLGHLVEASEALGLWTLEAKIFPSNKASIRLHEKHGFRIVGIREKLAQQHGIWRDVALLERRVDSSW